MNAFICSIHWKCDDGISYLINLNLYLIINILILFRSLLIYHQRMNNLKLRYLINYILFSTWDSKGEILESLLRMSSLCLQGGGSSGDNNASSSSKMISFDFANGDPFVPHVPAASIDDDDYVEYSLDNLADFPSNVEEEERVSRFILASQFSCFA